jgi:hypothetical protein
MIPSVTVSADLFTGLYPGFDARGGTCLLGILTRGRRAERGTSCGADYDYTWHELKWAYVEES